MSNPYKFTCEIYDKVDADTIYATKFCTTIIGRDIFAVALKGKVLLMECVDPIVTVNNEEEEEETATADNNDKQKVILLDSCVCDDYFYALAWGVDANSNHTPILAAGGEKGLIRIINFGADKTNFLIGHGELTSDNCRHILNISQFCSWNDQRFDFSSKQSKSLALWIL